MKRIWSVVVATSALCGAVAPAAHADDVLSCVFSGSVVNTPAVDDLSNEGAYRFTSVTGACAIADPIDLGESSTVVPVAIASDGEYESMVCGSGTADSEDWEGIEDETLWLIANPDEHWQESSMPARVTGPGPELPVELNYHIDFFAGLGVMTISNWAQDDLARTGVRSNHRDGVGALGVGTVQLGPPTNVARVGGPDPDEPDCMGGFTVTGSFTTTLTEPPGV